jgi:hypothetical protein
MDFLSACGRFSAFATHLCRVAHRLHAQPRTLGNPRHLGISRQAHRITRHNPIERAHLPLIDLPFRLLVLVEREFS